MTRLVTVAHGTRSAVGNQVALQLTAAAGERLGVPATASYVELCEPLFETVVRRLDEPAIVVPLLLSTGFHMRTDLPAAVASASAAVTLGGPLGPDPLLAAAQADRLLAAGASGSEPVVMVAAGSSDPDALAELEAAARLLAEAWGAPVRLATLAGLGPRLDEVVRPGDAVSAYLLAPGYFSDRARTESYAAGAAVVAPVIGPHPRVVDLVCRRAVEMLGAVATVRRLSGHLHSCSCSKVSHPTNLSTTASQSQ